MTPPEEIYVRNHALVPPKIDLSEYELKIFNGTKQFKSYTFDDLKKFKTSEVVSTMACSGNRRK